MPPTKSASLEEQVVELQGQVEALQNAIRKLSGQHREALDAVNNTNERIAEFRTEVARAFRDLPTNHVPGTGISRG